MFIPRSYYKLVEFIEKVIELKCKPVDTFLENMARRCRVRKNLLVHAITITVLTLSVLYYFDSALRYISGYLYPAFYTMEAMTAKKQNDMNRWLKYWAVYAILQVVEVFVDNFFGFLPMYHVAKALFVVWCYAPMECNGTNIIYDKYMLPAMELVKTNSLDTIGSKALDRLGDTLKIKLDESPENDAKQLKDDIVKAIADHVQAPALGAANAKAGDSLGAGGSKLLMPPTSAISPAQASPAHSTGAGSGSK